MKFLLDANFLLIPGKFKVDVFAELEKFGSPELYTLDLVVKELEKISESPGSNAKHAALGLRLIKKNSVQIISSQMKNADNELARLSSQYTVCTLDKALINRIRARHRQVIRLRQKKYLEKV